MTIGFRLTPLARSITSVALFVSTLTGCHGLLDVSDPTLIQDKDIANAAGANGKRLYAVMQIGTYVGYVVQDVALITDEYMVETPDLPTNPPWSRYELNLDRRDTQGMELLGSRDGTDYHLASLSSMFIPTTTALNAIRAYGGDSVKHEYMAQLFATRSYVLLQMAEDMCGGFPINDVTVDNQALQSGPYSTDSALAYARNQADSALANGRDTARFLNFARVMKGRALLNLGQYAAAAAAVGAVPTTFRYTNDSSSSVNPIALCCDFYYAVGEREGVKGLSFVSAQDLRVPTQFRQMRALRPADSLFEQKKYTDPAMPMVLASGIEARLIEAEAALHEPNPTRAFDILNALRATVGLTDLATPTTLDAQVDALYRERAFWLFLTGRRLGDLRRLIRNYGRNAETVFPTGAYPLGGSYGTATSIPFTVTAQGRYNPNIKMGCAAQ